MAHSAMHFALGMTVGTLFTLPPLLRDVARGRPLHRRFATWFAVSYALGIVAVFPGILRRLGLPDSACESAVMNIFLLYPWLNRVKPGGMTSGPLVMAAMLGFQYAALIAALAWVRRRKGRETAPR